MKPDWRVIFGPALTTAVALIAFYIDRHFVTVPNPAPLFVCIVALASSVSGMASGLVTAVIAVISSALFFLNHRALPGYDAHDIARMALLAMTAGGTAIITGMLRQKWVDAFASEQEHHATAARLSAALDQVDIGIVLLDSDTRAEFINCAFRDSRARARKARSLWLLRNVRPFPFPQAGQNPAAAPSRCSAFAFDAEREVGSAGGEPTAARPSTDCPLWDRLQTLPAGQSISALPSEWTIPDL